MLARELSELLEQHRQPGCLKLFTCESSCVKKLIALLHPYHASDIIPDHEILTCFFSTASLKENSLFTALLWAIFPLCPSHERIFRIAELQQLNYDRLRKKATFIDPQAIENLKKADRPIYLADLCPQLRKSLPIIPEEDAEFAELTTTSASTPS